MSFLLDTNICSAYIKRPRGLTHRFHQHSGRLAISTINLAELFTWAYGAINIQAAIHSIEHQILNQVDVLDFTSDCARRFGELRVTLRKQGITVSPTDMMISCAALVHDYTLVTHNVKDFKNIPDLRIVDWIEE